MEAGLAKRDYWLAGELAREIGVSTDTLRYYERKKVLSRPRRGANGYRLYPLDAVDRVRLIRRALSVGFTLDELASILAERDRGASPCGGVYALAENKLAQVTQRIEELRTLQTDLASILSEWKERLAQTKPGQYRLLESLADRPSLRRQPPNSKKRKKIEK